MIIIILFSVLGLFLMSKRIRQSIQVYKTIKQRLTQKPQLSSVRSNWFSILSFVLLCIVGCILTIVNGKNPSMAGLGIMVVLISIGELINAITINSFYYDDKGFYFYHKYFKFTQVKEIKKVKGMFGLIDMYSVETKSGDLFSISSAAYPVLEKKVKSTISKG